ncbi:hypothetical protein [Selenomonas sp.]|uniref:hypothetical protein n=1 Tax=Selenomonas sp. TaxID=2053611 RepID=UPI0025CC69B1|nr:hypothetical protein [Selenomonas sp.]MCI6284031.1 hypothetical protein [Selenomonas sp.]
MIERTRLDKFIVFDGRNRDGYTKYFITDEKIYYANISSRVHPVETMIFPCYKNCEPDFGKELYVAYHDEPKESYLLEDIANFLMEMGVKV